MVVVEDAGLMEKVNQWKKGLDTSLYKNLDEEGIHVSGGEGQKIAIARALYRQSPFIILDEPTAALDPVAEAEIYDRLNHIIKDRTAIFISHRLSSCKFADHIIVFDQGRVIEQGSHSSLYQLANTYRKLWDAQADYYVE